MPGYARSGASVRVDSRPAKSTFSGAILSRWTTPQIRRALRPNIPESAEFLLQSGGHDDSTPPGDIE